MILNTVFFYNDWDTHSQEAFNACKKILDQVVNKSNYNYLVIVERRLGPISFYQILPDRGKVIGLSAKNTYWANIVYQSSHEYYHAYIDSLNSYPKEYKWIEEVLCQVASYYALYKLGGEWAANNYCNNPANGINLITYADSNKNAMATLLQGSDYFTWFKSSSTQKELQNNPGNYTFVDVIAFELLPIFQNDPDLFAVFKDWPKFAQNVSSVNDSFDQLSAVSSGKIQALLGKVKAVIPT